MVVQDPMVAAAAGTGLGQADHQVDQADQVDLAAAAQGSQLLGIQPDRPVQGDRPGLEDALAVAVARDALVVARDALVVVKDDQAAVVVEGDCLVVEGGFLGDILLQLEAVVRHSYLVVVGGSGLGSQAVAVALVGTLEDILVVS